MIKMKRRNRQTGTIIQLHEIKCPFSEKSKIGWSLECRDHSVTRYYRTYKEAKENMSKPKEWCVDCMKEEFNEFKPGDTIEYCGDHFVVIENYGDSGVVEEPGGGHQVKFYWYAYGEKCRLVKNYAIESHF